MKFIKTGINLLSHKYIEEVGDGGIAIWSMCFQELLDCYKGNFPWGDTIIALSRTNWIVKAYLAWILKRVPFYGDMDVHCTLIPQRSIWKSE